MGWWWDEGRKELRSDRRSEIVARGVEWAEIERLTKDVSGRGIHTGKR